MPHRRSCRYYDMTQRIDYGKAAPQGLTALLGVENYVRHCGLPQTLLNLVRMRASQINGCAFCLDMHSKDARADGETEQRLYVLQTWREAPAFYNEREQAALEWTEAITRVFDGHVPDAIFERVRHHFTDKELVDLTFGIIAINSWNRLAIPFRTPAGSYQPARKTT